MFGGRPNLSDAKPNVPSFATSFNFTIEGKTLALVSFWVLT